jgi:hypothetical protein
LTAADHIYSIIRDPIQRVLSYHNHITVRDPNHPLHRQIKHLSIAKAANICPQFEWEVTNTQSWFLSGTKNFQEVKRVLTSRNVRLYEMREIGRMVNDIAADLGVVGLSSVESLNVSANDYITTVTEEDIEFVIRQNQEDIKLFEYIHFKNVLL